MCGIVGFCGNNVAAPFLLSGLEALEYRGYDSAGVALIDGDKINVRKTVILPFVLSLLFCILIPCLNFKI